ncbi:hypothetical protein FEM33_15560 [Dyadobacter flavalbus]|uniref:Uncharacterized protein n=1 Tax=Dyadobacter flavalbus TaxID=2579942 RepID=A0A5M8QRK7_9BACT|nr:hypothetical protein [Dyadobacter flavalbus]KAA6438835.1 hypothetical protein FEM33_15560 [Dyadobacter flavalbus]
MEDKIICRISIGGLLDDDFTFYEDGRIKRFYDNNQYSLNHTDFIDHTYFKNSSKLPTLLKKCPPEHLERIKQILGLAE